MTGSEHYGNNWKLAKEYMFLGAFTEKADGHNIVYDMYALICPNSVSFCLRHGEGINDVQEGYANIDEDGYWNIHGGDHVQFAALQYFANYHKAYVGNNSILPVGTVKTVQETLN